MKIRVSLVLAGLVAAAVVAGVLVPLPSAEAQPTPDSNAEVELIVSLGISSDGTRATLEGIVSNIGSSGQDGVRGGSDFQVDSFFDIYYVSNIASSGQDGVRSNLTVSNIGSSGQDGVSKKSDFQVDSFFDISYGIDGGKIDIELVALQLRATLSDPSDTAGFLEAVGGGSNGCWRRRILRARHDPQVGICAPRNP